MADIEGVGFTGSPGVNRTLLPEASIRPVRMGYGEISWPEANGFTTASPAHKRAFADLRAMDIPSLIRWVWEGLEIPGTASDYHFLLQGSVARLWSGRRSDPSGLQFLEVFAQLDLSLIEAVPRAFLIDEANPSKGFFRFPGVMTWVTLLETEGAFREALAVNRRLQRFDEDYRSEELEAKVASLDREVQ